MLGNIRFNIRSELIQVKLKNLTSTKHFEFLSLKNMLETQQLTGIFYIFKIFYY